MTKFHINGKGETGSCNAKTKCPFGGVSGLENHFSTEQEARVFYEKTQQEGVFNSLKISKDKIIDDTGIISADISRIYSQWSLVNDHLHASTGLGNFAELSYYSGPLGQLELKRRMSYETFGSNYTPYYDVFKKIRKEGPFHLNLTENEKESFAESLKLGKDLVKKRPFSKKAFKKNFEVFERRDTRLGAYLIEQSYDWIKNLSIEEQETVSHATSDGFFLVEESMRDSDYVTKETEQSLENILKYDLKTLEKEYDMLKDSSDETYFELEDKKALLVKNKCKDFTEKLKSAVEKAPKLDKPVLLYRGLKLHEISDTFGVKKEDREVLVKNLISGKLNGQVLSRSSFSNPNFPSKLSHAPISASLNPHRASSFAQRTFNQDIFLNNDSKNKKLSNDSECFMYEIEAKTMATPVSISAWGVGEAEVYTNHTSDYEIIGAYKHKDKQSDTLFTIIKLKEILNN